jgi:hypothetical protein
VHEQRDSESRNDCIQADDEFEDAHLDVILDAVPVQAWETVEKGCVPFSPPFR